VGLALHLYDGDFQGKLPDAGQTYDFNSQFSPENPLKVLRSYLGAKNPNDPVAAYTCPTAKKSPVLYYWPTKVSNTRFLISTVVLDRGVGKLRNPSRTVFIQEAWYLMNTSFDDPRRVGPAGSDAYSYWHENTPSAQDDWSGPPGIEHYSSVHNEGGNLIFSDGHAEYRKYRRISSLDFGLVDANGNDSLWQPAESHSRATYYYK